MPNKPLTPHERFLATAFVGATTVLTLADIILDLSHGADFSHVFLEALIVAAGTIILVILAKAKIREHRQTLRDVHRNMETATQEAQYWRQQAKTHLSGLGTLIERQLDTWQLTPSEKDVATLLIKGFSTQEIADIRQVTAKTVRQQAQSCYRKAGVTGRAELAAFFLEDLLAPTSKTAKASHEPVLDTP